MVREMATRGSPPGGPGVNGEALAGPDGAVHSMAANWPGTALGDPELDGCGAVAGDQVGSDRWRRRVRPPRVGALDAPGLRVVLGEREEVEAVGPEGIGRRLDGPGHLGVQLAHGSPSVQPDHGHPRAPTMPGTVVSAAMTERTPTPVRGVTGHARAEPDRPAMIMGDTVRTYGELDRRAARLASVLADLGAGPGKPVAIVLPNSIEIFEVAVAAAMLNAPFLPVNWHLKADELAYILADADVAAVVGQAGTDDDLSRALDHHGAGSLRVGAEYERASRRPPPLAGADSGAGPELMFYTSGTTARPKGVVHASLADDRGRVRGMEGQVALWSWTPDDVYVMSGPAYHASHLGWALCSLYVGRRHRHHRAVRGPVVPGRGEPAPGHPVVHGAGPLHPDPRDPRGRAGQAWTCRPSR